MKVENKKVRTPNDKKPLVVLFLMLELLII